MIFTMNTRASYKEHLAAKRHHLHRLLESLVPGNILPDIDPSPLEQGFRTRAKYKIFLMEKRFFARGTCPVEGAVPYEESLWILPLWGRQMVRRTIEVLKSEEDRFPVDGLEMRLSHGRKQGLAVLSVKKSLRKSYSFPAGRLLSEVKGLAGVAVPSQGEVFGKKDLKHRLLGRDVAAPYEAFFQSNPALTPRLIQSVVGLCSQKGEALLDLYCGVGLFSLFLAEYFSKTVGVDENSQAVDYARLNSRKRGWGNAAFVQSDCGRFLEGKMDHMFDCLVVDPPRSGCPPAALKKMIELEAECVCLVSCCPETHARDLRVWLDAGYSVTGMRALDMFPFTGFLETITSIQK